MSSPLQQKDCLPCPSTRSEELNTRIISLVLQGSRSTMHVYNTRRLLIGRVLIIRVSRWVINDMNRIVVRGYQQCHWLGLRDECNGEISLWRERFECGVLGRCVVFQVAQDDGGGFVDLGSDEDNLVIVHLEDVFDADVWT